MSRSDESYVIKFAVSIMITEMAYLLSGEAHVRNKMECEEPPKVPTQEAP